MKKDVLLTVVIPVYNVEKYLKRCVESVLVQEWHNYDILLVDDGSTDSSPQICDDYAKVYDFISVIHKKMKGSLQLVTQVFLMLMENMFISQIQMIGLNRIPLVIQLRLLNQISMILFPSIENL